MRTYRSGLLFFQQLTLAGRLFLLIVFLAGTQASGAGRSAVLSCPDPLMPPVICKVDTGGGILPLHNFSLTVILKENTVYLKWLAENEMNTEKFITQRSLDGAVFTDMGATLPAGPMNILTEYNAADDIQPVTAGIVYYRVRAEDNRGNYAYSNVVPVRLIRTTGFRFWPNPFESGITLSYTAANATSIRVEIYDNGGRQVKLQEFSVNRGMNQLSITGVASLSHGLYHLRITDLMTNEISVGKITK